MADTTARKVYYIYPGLKHRTYAVVAETFILCLAIAFAVYNAVFLKSRMVLNITIAGIFLYRPVMEYFFGFTLGQRICNMRIIDVNGKRPSATAALVRVVPFLPLFFMVSLIINSLYDAAAVGRYSGLKELLARGIPAGGLWYTGYLLSLLIVAADHFTIKFNSSRAWHDRIGDCYCVFRSGYGPGGKHKDNPAVKARHKPTRSESRPIRIAIMVVIIVIIYFAGRRFNAWEKLDSDINALRKGPEDAAKPPVPVKPRQSSCEVKGFSTINNNALVLIGGKTYGPGDTVCDAQITAVACDRVTVKCGKYGLIQFGVGSKIEGCDD